MGFGLIAIVGGLLMAALAGGVEPEEEELGEEILRDNDSVAGSNGDDMIDGNEAGEFILPHTGNNSVDAGGGDDTVSDYPWGQDRITSPAGLVNPNWGNDTFSGGDGDDNLIASGGADVVFGGNGDDSITGADLHPDAPYAPDLLDGGAGNDWLVGDDGDTLIGGDGEDFFTQILDDADGDDPIIVADYEPGEIMEVLIYDTDLLADGNPEAQLRDTDLGAILSVNGQDAVVFENALARDLNGNIRLLAPAA